MIRKFHDAKMEGRRDVVIWGSGSPRREFLHVDDLADVLPDTARIRVAGAEVVVADYAFWKRLVLERQSDRMEANHV